MLDQALVVGHLPYCAHRSRQQTSIHFGNPDPQIVTNLGTDKHSVAALLALVLFTAACGSEDDPVTETGGTDADTETGDAGGISLSSQHSLMIALTSTKDDA